MVDPLGAGPALPVLPPLLIRGLRPRAAAGAQGCVALVYGLRPHQTTNAEVFWDSGDITARVPLNLPRGDLTAKGLLNPPESQSITQNDRFLKSPPDDHFYRCLGKSARGFKKHLLFDLNFVLLGAPLGSSSGGLLWGAWGWSNVTHQILEDPPKDPSRPRGLARPRTRHDLEDLRPRTRQILELEDPPARGPAITSSKPKQARARSQGNM